MLARSSGAVQGLSFLFVFPLTFGSSTFVPASTLPDWLQGWVAINPVTHVIESMRGLLVGASVMAPGTTLGGEILWVVAVVRRAGRGVLPARDLGLPPQDLSERRAAAAVPVEPRSRLIEAAAGLVGVEASAARSSRLARFVRIGAPRASTTARSRARRASPSSPRSRARHPTPIATIAMIG